MILMQIGNMTETVEKFLDPLISYTPNIISAIALVLIGRFISKLIAGMVKRILVKIKIDRFGEKLNEIDMVEKANMEIKLSSIFGKIVYYFLFVFFLVAATDVLNMAAISELVLGLFNLIPKLIVGFIILIFGLLLSEGIRKLVETTLISLGLPSAKIIASVLFYFLLINVIVSAVAQAEINTAFLEQNISIIIAGAVLAFAIGYGLASREVVANFLSFFYSKDKVQIGDVITIDGDKGKVTDISRNSFTVDTGDRMVVYPLKMLMTEKIAIHKN